MGQSMTDLEREIMSYSEFCVDDLPEEEIPTPSNVAKYYDIINKNEKSSIFDRLGNDSDDETTLEASDNQNHNTSNSKPTTGKFDLVEELAKQELNQGHHVQYIGRGRGRGRGSTPYSAPPGPGYHNSNLSNNENIERKLRQHRIGLYEEEILANIKARQQEKREKMNKSTSQTPNGQTPSPGYKTPTASPKRGSQTPREHTPNSGYKTPTDSPKRGISPYTELLRYEENLSKKYSLNSNINYSNHSPKIDKGLTQQKLMSENFSGEFSSDSDSYYTINETSEDLTTDGQGYSVTNSSEVEDQSSDIAEPEEEPKKPLPLSQILKLGRAERKLKKSELNPTAATFKSNSLSSSSKEHYNQYSKNVVENVPDMYTKKIFKDIFGQSSKDNEETQKEIDLDSPNTENGKIITSKEEFSDENSEDVVESWELLYSDEEDKTLCITESDEEELSQRYIQQLLKQDKAEMEKKQQLARERQNASIEKSKVKATQEYSKWLTRNSAVQSSTLSSASSSGSSDETLPWRRRGGSPPRHDWSSKFVLKPAVNIQSVKDFPSLK